MLLRKTAFFSSVFKYKNIVTTCPISSWNIFPQYIKCDILNLIMLPYIMYIRLTVIIICAVKQEIVVLKKKARFQLTFSYNTAGYLWKEQWAIVI